MKSYLYMILIPLVMMVIGAMVFAISSIKTKNDVQTTTSVAR